MAMASITIATNAAMGGTTQAPVFIGDSPPAVASHGSLWLNTNFVRLFVYYDDGTSTQWIQV